MYYEINVSKNKRHFFATSDRSITDRDKLKEVLFEIASKFTKADGFEIMVSTRIQTGEYLTTKDLEEMGFFAVENLGWPK